MKYCYNTHKLAFYYSKNVFQLD